MLIAEAVRKKLDEYGIEIYSEYPMEKEYCIHTDQMMVFINEDEKNICLSFRADLKPEESSNYVLILSEIGNLAAIDVAESYAFDNENNFITGDNAFNFVREYLISEAVSECVRQQTYNDILRTTKCFNC